jgi:hypothetical protein
VKQRPATLRAAGKPVIVAAGGGLPGPGYTFIADESVAADLWRVLTSQASLPAACLLTRPGPGSALAACLWWRATGGAACAAACQAGPRWRCRLASCLLLLWTGATTLLHLQTNCFSAHHARLGLTIRTRLLDPSCRRALCRRGGMFGRWRGCWRGVPPPAPS